MLDVTKWKEWLKSHPDLTQGVLAFKSYGLGVVVNSGKWDKAGFFLYNEDGQEVSLPLLHGVVRFRVHRDLFTGKEFEAYIEDPLVA